jgi:predicted RNA binding protein YcfA (HicA-like mRNA interferase family)
MPAKARDLQKAARKLGFQMVRQKGSIVRWKHPDGMATTIPVHGDSEIEAGFSTKSSSNWA